MTNFRYDLRVTWPVLYVGLKNNWLTTKEVTDMINLNSEELNCPEQVIIDININEHDKAKIIDILRRKAGDNDSRGNRLWELAHLIAIEKEELSIYQKLREIDSQWARFGYPESWKDFIYYLPNQKIDTEESVYENFLAFLKMEKENLNS